MRWKYKVVVQKTLSQMPAGEHANYLLQRHVTRKLPASEGQFFMHFDESARHLRAFEEHCVKPVELVRAYEFGAGWDLIGPLSLWAMGISQQLLVDIDTHMRLELVNHSLVELGRHHEQLQKRVGHRLRRADPSPVDSVADLRERFGIEYRAPCDARSTGLAAGSFDLILSTFTLEHIPRGDIGAILVESHRLLADGGIISCSVDMADHYGFDDSSISVYNFLRFSERRWRLVNSSLHYQNRMRARDYRALFDAAGLEILEEELHTPSDEHREQLRSLPLAPRFARGYSLDELEPVGMMIVARGS